MGTAEGERLAEQIVRLATASNGGETRTSSSFAEYRTRSRAGDTSVGDSYDATWWKYVAELGEDRRHLLTETEHRVMSKATGGAGGFLVPQDMDVLITTARRTRGVIGAAARELVTTHGRTITAPIAATHGTGTWTAENAAYTASDETITQGTLSAFKATTKIILSEELETDALDDFDRFLADELGQRLAALEEAAFATGDGAGKPHGITHSTNGVATVAAATGSATTFKLADFRTAYAALPPAYAASATWIMSPSAFANAAGDVDTAGAPKIPSLHGTEPSLFGRPVLISPELPVAAASARSVVVGDIAAGYAVRRVRGLGVQRQSELHSDSGQVGLRIHERVDGRVVLPDALRILVHSAT